MTSHPYSQLVGYKRWADRGLCDVVAENLGRLDDQDVSILSRILDHMHVVDKVFQHHLQGLAHSFAAPRSEALPDLRTLVKGVGDVDDWYASYVGQLPERNLEDTIDFTFTNGTPARMRRGEIILHVCLHGTYHRGNAGIVLQKKGIAPNDDRMTDFILKAA